jgi:hypothetical protein
MAAFRLPDDPTLDRDAAAIASMAFDKACRDLGLIDYTHPITEVIAKKILDVTRSGERDAQRIWERTLQELDTPPPL